MDPKEASLVSLLALKIHNGWSPTDARNSVVLKDPFWNLVADAVVGLPVENEDAVAFARRYDNWFQD